MVTLEIEEDDGTPVFGPGQFNMLSAFGVGEAAISFSGSHEGRPLHTVRDVGPVSRALCRAAAGDVVGIRGPFGVGWDVASAEGSDIVIVAGGIGLAPLRPAILAVLGRRDRYGGVWVLVGARSPEVMLFQRELRSWAEQGVEVGLTVDHAGPGWVHHVGLVTKLLGGAAFDPPRTVAFVCGPEVMMRFAARDLADAGVPGARIRLSLERNMRCAIGLCGHCQLAGTFVCRNGPVYPYTEAGPLLAIREL